MEMTFQPAAGISGAVRPPGDKSISHRALIAAAMTKGHCSLKGIAPGADVGSTQKCLQALGYEVKTASRPASELRVLGNGWRPAPSATLDAGNSGTTMRLLAGALAGSDGRYVLTGDSSLSNRPMGRVAEPLRLMGGNIELGEQDRPPLKIAGAPLRAIEYQLPVPSAQVKGAILYAGLRADGRTTVYEAVASRDHTERLLQWLGAKVDVSGGSVEITAGENLFEHPGFDLAIPGDFSSAAYFLAAAILSPRGRVEIQDVGINGSRTGFLEILRTMGADVGAELSQTHPEPWGTLTAASSGLQGVEVGGSVIPAAIDELPLVALAATQAVGTTVIRDAAELRVKESDRVETLCIALRAMGASIEERPDGWEIEGPTRLAGGRVDPRGDHRIALTLAVAATLAEGPVCVQNWECTHISYPGFERDLAKLVI